MESEQEASAVNRHVRICTTSSPLSCLQLKSEHVSTPSRSNWPIRQSDWSALPQRSCICLAGRHPSPLPGQLAKHVVMHAYK